MSTRLLLALTLVAAPATVLASSQAPKFDTATTVDSLRVQAELQRAEKATYAGRTGEARTIYRKLLDQHRDAGEYAKATLWNLALHYLYHDDTRNAAATLDELAKQANQFGDPTMELRATFEAAVLWNKRKAHAFAAEHAVRIKDLMKSPVIAESEKAEFRRRMS